MNELPHRPAPILRRGPAYIIAKQPDGSTVWGRMVRRAANSSHDEGWDEDRWIEPPADAH